MTGFLLALQFLTIIPIKLKEASKENIASAMIYFPLVGLGLGLFLLAASKILVILNFSPLAASIFLVVSLAAITGGMHLDGLSDTADAFLSGKPKEEMLALMRDPHVGAMGVLSLISIILLKVGLLFSLAEPERATALILMCVLSRWAAVLAMFLFPYARKDGKAGVFIRGMNKNIFVISTALAVICSFVVWGLKGLAALLIISGCTFAAGKFASRKIGGITGDTLGATVECSEVIILFIVSLMQGAVYG